MDFSKTKYNSGELIKLFGFMVVMISHYYAIKNEISEIRTLTKADKTVINYRLDRLEAFHAILPKEPKIETE